MVPSSRISILGCPIDNLTLQETLQEIDRIIRSRKPSQHVVINADKLVKLRRDPALKEIVSRCAIINADGMPIVWASRLLGTPLKERVVGIEVMEALVRHGAEKGYSFYFLGAKPEIVERVVRVYQDKYPRLKVAGFRNGYWSADEEADVVKTIVAAGADVLFVAMSSPKKEAFLNRYLNNLNVPFVMGVGGSFDVIAGLTRRAPCWMQTMGLEWFYRMIQEPRRLLRRYLFSNTAFILIVLKELFKERFLTKSSL